MHALSARESINCALSVMHKTIVVLMPQYCITIL
jgi:hypothetical protein